jgi:hypothetical protein
MLMVWNKCLLCCFKMSQHMNIFMKASWSSFHVMNLMSLVKTGVSTLWQSHIARILFIPVHLLLIIMLSSSLHLQCIWYNFICLPQTRGWSWWWVWCLNICNCFLISLMEWDYVFELLPLTDIMFIPQMIYEYGEQWWIDTDRGKLKN